MSRKKVIVKQINAIQNFGAMDVLCTDKTGTLTEDRIVLGEHLDTAGRKSEDVLRLAAVNSVNQTGLRSLLDDAVIEAAGPEVVEEISRRHGLVDEIPFDFKRRRLSVVVDHGDADLIVTKGAVEELLSVCESVELDGVTHQLTPGWLARVDRLVAELNGQGKRVLAVATKTVVEEQRREYSTADEEGMTLVGLLAFLDPPKESAAGAIEALASHGVAVKVVTGDNELVAETVCGKVGIDVGTVVSGAEIEALSDDALDELVQRTTVFAKTDPMQKARIVESLRRVGHTVGFLGDGVNDAPALRAADVGISVDTAADIARESADIILLEKDLGVLEQGVIEGRRTFGNIQKYIKMTASSNFGNVFSVLVASALLPFIPMIPVVLLLQNLIYDLSMLTIPWDRVDDDFLAKPRKWETKSLRRFMVFIGPISSIFDISTFALMCSCSPPTLPSMQRCSNRLVHRVIDLADADRSHDPHPQDPVHPVACIAAGTAQHGRCLRLRAGVPVHVLGSFPRVGFTAVELLPVAGPHPRGILRRHAGGQGNVHSSIRDLALGVHRGNPRHPCADSARARPRRCRRDRKAMARKDGGSANNALVSLGATLFVIMGAYGFQGRTRSDARRSADRLGDRFPRCWSDHEAGCVGHRPEHCRHSVGHGRRRRTGRRRNVLGRGVRGRRNHVGEHAVEAVGRMMDHQPARTGREEPPADYTFEVTCHGDAEAHIRGLTVQSISRPEFQLRSVQSFDIPDSDRVRVVAELAAAERDDGLLESAVSRLSLEPLVTHVRWEVEPSK